MKKIFIIFILTGMFFTGCSYENTIGEWQDGRIPYFLSGDFSDDDIEDLEWAMRRWEGVCGVKFEEVLPRANAYEIIRVSGARWSSSIGENNNFCHMLFGDSAYPRGHILHELGHCLGLLHEHQRPDRNLYVEVVWSNIYPEYQHNFDIRDNPLIVENDYDYECTSIMHYHAAGFSINGEDTIVPREDVECGERGVDLNDTEDNSKSDSKKARYIYGPPLDD